MDQENQMNMPNSYDKWRWSMYIGIVFLLVANPYTYNLVNHILKYFDNPFNANLEYPTTNIEVFFESKNICNFL